MSHIDKRFVAYLEEALHQILHHDALELMEDRIDACMTLMNLAGLAWLAGSDSEAGTAGPALVFPKQPLGVVLTGTG